MEHEMNGEKLDLHFPAGTMEGFTASGIQRFSELNPACIVRELIQNSLDAARDANHDKATVHFELESRPITDVPAIDSYRRAVQSAIRDQTKRRKGKPLQDKVKKVVGAIERCLAEDRIEFISILDNGLGLNQRRMESLLSDGVNDKQTETSTGTVGNGHFSAIPASDLRYILYGGISGDGKRIAAGHAILASFEQNDFRTGKDGYYVQGIGKSMDKLYDFPSGDDIEPLINEKLDWIEGNSKNGAAVIIPGFNRFRYSDADLWSIIQRAAACNFLVAITDGHLEITYKDHIEDIEEKLNKSNIKNVFEGKLASQKRSKDSLPGKWAAEGYQTIVEGEAKQVETGFGKVEVIVRKASALSQSRIDLFRNGMWITHRVPNLKASKFNDWEPFHCLIKVSADDGPIHQLIRTSEGSLHNSIERSELSKDEWRQLCDAFEEISKFLKDNLEKLELKTFPVSDFLIVPSAKGMERGHYANSFEEVPPRKIRTLPDGPKTSKDNDADVVRERKNEGGIVNGSKTANAFKGNSIHFEAVPVSTGLRSGIFELDPDEELSAGSGAAIWFVLDENIDETCDSANEQRVKLKAVKLNGESVPDKNLLKGNDGDIEGVSLGRFKKGDKLSFDYDLPNGVDVRATERVVLSAKMVSRRN